MSNPSEIYEQLADWYDQHGDARQRDGFLALAADASRSSGRPDQAERYRQRLLQASPYHLLRPYPTFSEALQSPDVTDYLNDLRSQFPPDRAASLLDSLRGSAPSAANKTNSPQAATLLGSPAHPGTAPIPVPLPASRPRRRDRVSPYDEPTPFMPVPARTDGPTLTWVPGLLFLLVLFIGLGWGLYTLVGPFLDGR